MRRINTTVTSFLIIAIMLALFGCQGAPPEYEPKPGYITVVFEMPAASLQVPPGEIAVVTADFFVDVAVGTDQEQRYRMLLTEFWEPSLNGELVRFNAQEPYLRNACGMQGSVGSDVSSWSSYDGCAGGE